MDIKTRFESKVTKNKNGCWNFAGSTRGKNYKCFWMNGKPEYAHRAAYVLYVSDIPENSIVHHKCNGKFCVNPKHLQCTTWDNNLAEMNARGRYEQEIKNLTTEIRYLRKEIKSIKRSI